MYMYMNISFSWYLKFFLQVSHLQLPLLHPNPPTLQHQLHVPQQQQQTKIAAAAPNLQPVAPPYQNRPPTTPPLFSLRTNKTSAAS